MKFIRMSFKKVISHKGVYSFVKGLPGYAKMKQWFCLRHKRLWNAFSVDLWYEWNGWIVDLFRTKQRIQLIDSMTYTKAGETMQFCQRIIKRTSFVLKRSILQLRKTSPFNKEKIWISFEVVFLTCTLPQWYFV